MTMSARKPSGASKASALDRSIALNTEKWVGSAASAVAVKRCSKEPDFTKLPASAVEAPAAATPRMKCRRVPEKRPLKASSGSVARGALGSIIVASTPLRVRLRRGRLGPVAPERQRQLDDHPHAEARPALARVGLARVPGGPGDVDVRPRHVAREALEELRGDDRARLAGLDRVGDVGV